MAGLRQACRRRLHALMRRGLLLAAMTPTVENVLEAS